MAASFRLGILLRGVGDSAMVFRHQAQQAEDFYGETSHFWRDHRGASFALKYLEPQMRLAPIVSTSFLDLSAAVSAAKEAVEVAERNVASIQAAGDGVEVLAEQSLRDAANADSHSTDAASRARRAQSAAAGAARRATALGGPPV